jgi:hypothetical protein
VFEGLNAIPWGELTHAYGSAEEVPMWLRQLASDNTGVRKEAMNDLWGSICHQNWICPATGYAVPFLIELLQEPSVQDKDEILGLLADIATAEPLNERPWRDNPRLPILVVPAHIPFKDARTQVAARISVYVSLLEHERVPVRIQAAHVIVAFPERSAEVWPNLTVAYERETDDRERAILVIALGRLAKPASEDLRFFDSLVHSSESELLRFVAALQLAQLAREQAPPDTAEVLIRVVREGRPTSPSFRPYEELTWGGGDANSAAIRALQTMGVPCPQLQENPP